MILFFISTITGWWWFNQQNEGTNVNQITETTPMPSNIVQGPFFQLKHLNFPLNPLSKSENVFKHDISEVNPANFDRRDFQKSKNIDFMESRTSHANSQKDFYPNEYRNFGERPQEFHSNQKGRNIIRKELRALSLKELSNYLLAVYKLHKEGLIDDLSLLHLACEHYSHNNPRFLPWHRAFLLYYEMLLKLMVKDVILPYWDWSLDAQNVKKSMALTIWPTQKEKVQKEKFIIKDIFKALIKQKEKDKKSKDIHEKTSNTVKKEPDEAIKNKKNPTNSSDHIKDQINSFKEELNILKHSIPKEFKKEMCWKVNIPKPHCLTRSGSFDFLYETARIKKMIQEPFEQFASPFELVPHAIVHLVIGGLETETHIGDMAMLYSCNDPLFFLHHSYCDYIWQAQQYRQRVEKLRKMIQNGHEITKKIKKKIKNKLKGWEKENKQKDQKKKEKKNEKEQNNTKDVDFKESIKKIKNKIEKIGLGIFIKEDLFREPDFLYEILSNNQFPDLIAEELSDYTGDPNEQLFPFNITVRDVWESNVFYEPYKINYHFDTNEKKTSKKPKKVKEIHESFIKRHKYDKRKVRRMERKINERETVWDRIIGT